MLSLLSSALLDASIYRVTSSPDIQRDYVLAGDNESPARAGVAVEGQVTIYVTSGDSEDAYYRFAWTLEQQASDGSWVSVPLTGSTVSTAQRVNLDSSSSGTVYAAYEFEDTLTLSSPLDPYTNYRTTAQLQRKAYLVGRTYSNVGDPKNGSASKLYEFTNTYSWDSGYNVITTLDSTSLSNPFLLDDATDPDKRGFKLDIAATARRWDGYLSSLINLSSIGFRFEVEVREASTGNLVPLENSTFQKNSLVASYANSGSARVPAAASFTDTLTLVPLGQLDPLNEAYDVSVQISHWDSSLATTPKLGNSVELADQVFYHFNGDLDFGSIATTFTDFTRTPQPSSYTYSSYVLFSLGGVEGYLTDHADYTYDAPSTMWVRLYSDGSAVVSSFSGEIPVTQPSGIDGDSYGGVRFVRDSMSLNSGGLESELTVYLPQGMGYRSSGDAARVLSNSLIFEAQGLNNDLHPSASSMTYTPDYAVGVMEETKPVYVYAEQITWFPASGEFKLKHPSNQRADYVRAAEYSYLRNAPVPVASQVKPDNSGYYHALDETVAANSSIAADANGTAALSSAFSFHSGDFKSHFPLDAEITFSAGELSIEADNVVDGQLTISAPVTLHYDQTCVDVACADENHIQQGEFNLDLNALYFTSDGGLVGTGPLTEGTALEWGYIEALSTNDPVYAQSIGKFAQATFHMTGHFLRGQAGDSVDFSEGASADLAARNAPSDTLLAAVMGPANAQTLARPGSAGDLDGKFYYAGINLENDANDSITGLAYIAGEAVLYSLRSCNKFYVRQAGVTGTVEAAPGTFPEGLKLNGYDFEFDYYGLGYLDSSTSPQRSFTKGSLSVPYPTESAFEFEGLSFTCLGGLSEARLPEGGLAKNFKYWNADIDVSTLGFTSTDSCNPASDAFLSLGATAYSTLLDHPLYGMIGIQPKGAIINREFSLSAGLETELTSRMGLPNNLRLTGPAEETYSLTAITGAYFNDYDLNDDKSPGAGRLNFAAKADVPFLEDLAIHVRTTASKNTNPNAVIDLMGGWTENGQTYFSAVFFDSSNRGFPAGVDEALYRNESGASGDPKPYLIRARQEWLDVVAFEYPLDWSSSLRSFTAYEPTQNANLLILQVDHQLDYLSAENAEIIFGAQYEGMPRINLTNFVFNKIEENTGVLEAATHALTDEVVGAIDDGISSLDELLQDQIDALLDEFLVVTVDPIIDEFYTHLETASNTVGSVNEWTDEVNASTQKFFVENVEEPANNIRHAISELDSVAEDASSLVYKVDQSLEKVQLALRSIHDRIYILDGEIQLEAPAVPNPANIIDGMLLEEGGEYPIVEALIAHLIDEVGQELGSEFAAMLNDSLTQPVGELQRLINEQLEPVRPTLERIRTVLADLDGQVGELREEIENGTQFIGEFQDILAAADSQIVDATNELKAIVDSMVIADIPDPALFVEYTAEELKQRVRSEIQDQIRSLDLTQELQQVLRQYLADLDQAITEGIDTAFAQVNVVLKNLLSSYLNEFDDTINGVLGDIDSVVGAGEVNGFAHINGDALRLLRLDAVLQLKVPKAMEFEGYFQLKQMASDGTGSCSYSADGSLATEITIGTPGVPVEWLSPGMEIAVEGKVTFSDRPLGLGGRIEMVGGSFNFEAFEVTDLGAAISFGASENYLAAKVGLRFQSYSLYGGVFFGQTCSITPVELVNQEAASVIGPPDPSFTGAYVYGEGHIPVSEAIFGIPATCMFQITAGVGAGAFYFAEEPTYGGQMLLAVSGEALCLVGVNGEVAMIGVKEGDDLRFRGRGEVGGSVGSCPFCVTFSKSLILEYINDRWKFQL